MESVDDIFLNARELAEPAKRLAYVAQACGGDDVLRARVEAMLRDAEGAEAFFGKDGSVVVVPLAERPGTVIGRYKLLEKIGEGGMGVVYMAEQREPVVRKVALKIIKLGMDTGQVVARFEAERQALALMDHPNIARVLDAGSTDTGRPYFVMDLVQGLPITQFCDEANLPTRERLDLVLDVCSAIQHAHEKGIIHRDLKPSNILVTLHGDKPVAKVIDFGIAKATQGRLTEKTIFTQFQHFIGTPAYMSPEQASLSGLDVDLRSDIYALGVLLYELLTGKTPFDAGELIRAGLEEMRRTLREEEPRRPSARVSTLQGEDLAATARNRHTIPPRLIHLLRGDLDWIVMKCLEKDRARRYETVAGLATDLQRHLGNRPVVARPPSAAYRFRKLVLRNKAAFTAAVAAVPLALVASALTGWQAMRAARAEREAGEQAALATTVRRTEAYRRRVNRDYQMARALELQGQMDKAAELFADVQRLMVEFLPDHREDCAYIARFFVGNRSFADARDAYETLRKSLENDPPRRSTEFLMLVEATAATKGWPAAADACRGKLTLLADDPIAWRAKAMTFLYIGNEEGYQMTVSETLRLASSATNRQDLLAILHVLGRGSHPIPTNQTHAVAQALERARERLAPSLEPRDRQAMAAVMLRLGRFEESRMQLEVSLALRAAAIDEACSWLLKALCLQHLARTAEAYSAFLAGERRTPLQRIEALGEYEPFLAEAECYYLILRRRAQELIPGARVDSLARRGRWEEATLEAAQALERDPTNYWNPFTLAPLLVARGDHDAYRQLCRRITAQFGQTRLPGAAEFMAKSCLILPAAGADPSVVSNLVRVAVTGGWIGPRDEMFAQFTKGLSEYRQDHFASATHSLRKALNLAATRGGDFAFIEARMVLAMGQYRLGLTNEAHATLTQGLALADTTLPRLESGDLGSEWRYWLRSQAFMKEARALIPTK